MSALCLAIEIAAGPMSCALLRNGDVLAYKVAETDFGRVESLTTLTNSVLKRGGVSAGDLDIIAATNGPGSYTGIRAGIAFGQGLAAATRAELRLVSLFDAFACNRGLREDGLAIAVKTGSNQVDLLDERTRQITKLAFGSELEARLNECNADGHRIICDGRLRTLTLTSPVFYADQPFAIMVAQAAISANWKSPRIDEFLVSHF